MDVYERMNELGIVLPEAPGRGGVYAPVKEFAGNLAYISGCGPQNGSKNTYIGKLGQELTLEQGQAAARNAILNVLAVLDRDLCDLNRVKKFVKLLAFVSSASDFYQQPQVVNPASELLASIWGEEGGCAARSAIAVNALPGNIAIEIEALIELT